MIKKSAMDFIDMIYDEDIIRVKYVVIGGSDIDVTTVEYVFHNNPAGEAWEDVYLQIMRDTDGWELITARAYKKNCYEISVERDI